MKFSYLNTEDLPMIQEITVKAYGHLPWTEQQYQDDLALSHTFYIGMYHNEKLVGYSHWSVIDQCAELLNIAILPDYQGQHFGQQLLCYSMTQLEYETMLLEVRASNMIAIQCYTQVGFQKLYIRKQYYKHPVEDAIIMQYNRRI